VISLLQGIKNYFNLRFSTVKNVAARANKQKSDFSDSFKSETFVSVSFCMYSVVFVARIFMFLNIKKKQD
jgi:hypothetical protein